MCPNIGGIPLTEHGHWQSSLLWLSPFTWERYTIHLALEALFLMSGHFVHGSIVRGSHLSMSVSSAFACTLNLLCKMVWTFPYQLIPVSVFKFHSQWMIWKPFQLLIPNMSTTLSAKSKGLQVWGFPHFFNRGALYCSNLNLSSFPRPVLAAVAQELEAHSTMGLTVPVQTCLSIFIFALQDFPACPSIAASPWMAPAIMFSKFGFQVSLVQRLTPNNADVSIWDTGWLSSSIETLSLFRKRDKTAAVVLVWFSLRPKFST